MKNVILIYFSGCEVYVYKIKTSPQKGSVKYS